MSLKDKIDTKILPFIKNPLHYTGTEGNVIKKDHDGKIKVLLAFPDKYEIGMSYNGFNILYHILNSIDYVVCERVYVPDREVSQIMRENDIPLFSLESKTAVNEFDIIGITLPYELDFANILEMLDLAGIPFRNKYRNESHPFIIGGGSNVSNPEPVADFFDCFVIGDGEDSFPEIVKIFKSVERKNLLTEIDKLPYTYIPSFFIPVYENGKQVGWEFKGIKKEISKSVSDLNKNNYPLKPLTPQVDITHDRVSTEIMRGCTRGCRFCAAGYYYRPVRERNKEDLLNHIDCNLTNSGHSEVSLLSLSTSDYTDIDSLLDDLYARYSHGKVKIAFPSIRAESFTEKIADIAKLGRLGSFTFAPEAGSARLKMVINKDLSESTIMDTLDIILPRGWRKIKLYFMIGLPTETDDDIHEMADFINKIYYKCSTYGKVAIHVAISPFNPKPHTPFQWAKQFNKEDLERRIDILKSNVKRSVRLDWRDPDVSALEAIISRGDRFLSNVIEHAYSLGAGFEGWGEYFDFSIWTRAFDELGINYFEYLRERETEEFLPWDIINIGVSKKYLESEWIKSQNETLTPYCREKCTLCGIEKRFNCKKLHTEKMTHTPIKVEEKTSDINNYIRIKYHRDENTRFLSQKNLIKLFTKWIIMTKAPVAYSKGFNSIPRISTSFPLSFGFTSECEYADMNFQCDEKGIQGYLNKLSNIGLNVEKYGKVEKKCTPLQVFITYSEYEVKVNQLKDKIEAGIDKFKSNESIIFTRLNKKKQEVIIDLKSYIEKLEYKNDILTVGIKYIDSKTAKMSEIFEHLFGITGNDFYIFQFNKTKSGNLQNGNLIEPI